MHHYAVFHTPVGDHAPLGESIGSHLCASYTTYGGFNTKQAGSSVASKDKLGNDDTARVMERFELNGSILIHDENHARELELAQKMLAAEQKISQDRQPMTEQELKDALLYQNRRVLEVGLKLDIVQGQARENVLLQSCPRRLIGALKMFWLWRD
ncbi:hypothetical protein LTR15_008430 [Elasticomyces elasticus]|nr:hypothetical protein LTR15_008430 [Elasticomyces elasticus]